MLRATLVCAALALFIAIPSARAQGQFPGIGPLYGNGTIQGGRDYDDWQQTRRDHGLDYDHSIDQRRDTYQPYPSVSPSYGSDDPYRSRPSYGHSYGDDD
jgi:hypothetical protein